MATPRRKQSVDREVKRERIELRRRLGQGAYPTRHGSHRSDGGRSRL